MARIPLSMNRLKHQSSFIRNFQLSSAYLSRRGSQPQSRFPTQSSFSRSSLSAEKFRPLSAHSSSINSDISQLVPSDVDGIQQAAEVLVSCFPYDDTHSWARVLQFPKDGLPTFLRQCIPSCLDGLGTLVIRSPSRDVEAVLLLEDFNRPEPAATNKRDAPPPSQGQAILRL